MASADRVSAVAPRGLTQGDSTPGIVREVAFATDRALHVRGRVNGGVVSGWHHHGDREVLGYVVRGRLRFEFGPGGAKSTEVEGEGGFFHVPVGLVHRDVNLPDELQEFVTCIRRRSRPLVNLDGPSPPEAGYIPAMIVAARWRSRSRTVILPFYELTVSLSRQRIGLARSASAPASRVTLAARRSPGPAGRTRDRIPDGFGH